MQTREATNAVNRYEGINQLAAKNAEYRKAQDEANDRLISANVESAITTDNANIQAENEALNQIADAENRAAAARYQDRAQRAGRLLNGLSKAGSTVAKVTRKRELSDKYTALAKLNNEWVAKYKARYDKAVADKDDAGMTNIVAEFIDRYDENPLNIGTKAATIKQYILDLSQ
jgi:hypothetical protein